MGIFSSEGFSFSELAGMMFMWSTIQQLIPQLTFIWRTIQQLVPQSVSLFLEKLGAKLHGLSNPYVHIKFPAYLGAGEYNDAYYLIGFYLSTKSSKQAARLKGAKFEETKSMTITLDDGEETIDEFNGVLLKWKAKNLKAQASTNSSSSTDETSTSCRTQSYVLVFHKRYREMVTEIYLNHVIREGKAIWNRNRKRKLFTNKAGWESINFKHPANFNTLAMDPKKKQEIIADLDAFKKRKEYYGRIGKTWKRGYLLYGPPGTGKSTMIAAIANYMDYDIYDLELTSVTDNAELKELLTDTRSKSIIVIEDIDCSLDFTGKRKEKDHTKSEEDQDMKSGNEKDSNSKSKVTLSGLLNVIDGIWSACGQQRIIIFTTNHVEKLDPALIRRGRMDMHIEMSYCKFEAFKTLAKNYLDIDSHPLFEEIRLLLEENEVRPCDVAENLMPKADSRDAETCLRNLIEAINAEKERQQSKAKDEQEQEEIKGSKSAKRIVPQKETHQGSRKVCTRKIKKWLTIFKKL
ncbi:OLC1v1009130C1 [Oldenlandia corymbosa var. corymbosa]|uniref:OLC1v1009130C1 n=1 Tax=Oldenlandia corymbosa var. corymbosa TaxID=529605 RepID=A0AAV1DQP4_OLDCO|nr:OLC1v1009130C1 [Oldenlandia corymbosa var. corymbosa]